MKSTLSLTIFSQLATLLICLPIIAQTPVVKLSEEFKLDRNKFFEGHLDSDAEGHYLYYYQESRDARYKTAVVVTKFDKAFNEIWSYDYYPEERRTSTYGLKTVNNKFLWLFAEEPDRTERDYFLVAIDKNGDLGKRVKVNSIEFKTRGDEPNVDWSVSEDSTMVAVVQSLDRNSRDVDFEYDVTVLDDELKVLWKSSIWMKKKSQEQIEVISSVLGNDGAFYSLVKEYEDRNAREVKRKKTRGGRKKVPAYDLKIYKLGEGMTKPEILTLNLKDKFAKGASLAVGEDGTITCVGMYGNDRRGNINGVFYQSLDPTGQVMNTYQKEFSVRDLEVLGNRNSDEERGGKGSIEGVFRFGDQLTQTDGSTIITAEHNYEVNTQDANGFWRTTFHSRDVIIIHFEAEGKVRGINLIPKRQSSTTNTFLSHAGVALDDQPAYFIYNDHKENIDRAIDKRPRQMRSASNGVTALAYIDEAGDLQREVLLDNKKLRSLILPYTCKRIDENSFFFIAMKPKFLSRPAFIMGTAEF